MDFLDAPDGHAAVTTDREWWLQQFPHLPEEVLEFMGRVEDGTEAAALRRRWEKSRGLVVHLFAGKDAREWRREDWKGYEVITIDMEENARQNLHDAALWGYLWYLAKKGLIRAAIGGPPCRTISRLRHNPPGPKPLRGRDQRRYGLPGLSMEDRRGKGTRLGSWGSLRWTQPNMIQGQRSSTSLRFRTSRRCVSSVGIVA